MENILEDFATTSASKHVDFMVSQDSFDGNVSDDSGESRHSLHSKATRATAQPPEKSVSIASVQFPGAAAFAGAEAVKRARERDPRNVLANIPDVDFSLAHYLGNLESRVEVALREVEEEATTRSPSGLLGPMVPGGAENGTSNLTTAAGPPAGSPAHIDQTAPTTQPGALAARGL